MPTNSFPLYRLPYVALREVLSEAGPLEIFILSTCSQRSFQIIKSIKRSSQKCEIVLNPDFVWIYFENDSGEYNVPLHIGIRSTTHAPKDQNTLRMMRIGNFKVPMEFIGNTVLETYWDDEKTGIKEMGVYLTDIFHRPISDLVIGENSKWIVDFLNTRQKSVAELHYQTGEANADDVSYVFSNLKVDNWMNASLKFPDQLTHPEIRIAPMSLDSVEISEGSWMTLEHILAFDCEIANFHVTNLRSQDLNTLLKHWMNGGFSRLKELCVRTRDAFNYDIVLEGVEFEEVPRTVVRQYRKLWGLEQINGGFDMIRKSDGLPATLFYYGNPKCFVLMLTSKLQVL